MDERKNQIIQGFNEIYNKANVNIFNIYEKKLRNVHIIQFVHILCSQAKKHIVKIILYVTFIPILFRHF